MSIIHFSSVLNSLVTSGAVVLNNHLSNEDTIGTAFAKYDIARDGSSRRTVNGVDTAISGEWWSLEPETNIGDLYEIRATDTGVDPVTGTFGVWTQINSLQTWSMSQSLSPTLNGSILVEIGLLGSSTALDSATITFQVAGGA